MASAIRTKSRARAPGETRQPAIRSACCKTLLADRFQLKMHRESREMQVYNLVVGSSGPKIKPVLCRPAEDGRRRLIRVADSQCGTPISPSPNSITDIMSQFDRPLLDKTGLTGAFDFTLEYRPQPPA